MTQLTAGKLAKAAGVNVETLRYYEKRELLPKPERTGAGYRIYPESMVERLHFIKGAQALGFTLEEIGELLNMRVDESVNRVDVRTKAQRKIADIDDKIAVLQSMRTALHNLTAQCHGDGSTTDCPILDGMTAQAQTVLMKGG